MKVFRKVLLIGLIVIMMYSLVGCSSAKSTHEEQGVETINIAYQYGVAYSPAIIVQHNKMIEKAYEEATGKTVQVTWTQMSSGADINVAIASGNIDVGFMGVAPAISGITKQVGYRIFTNVSGQEHGIMSNNKEVVSLEHLVDTDQQIALVNTGSIQHIILARALKNAGFDAHALDSNIVAMKHPDGMSALQSGSVSCHLTTNPYLYKEQEDASLYEVEGLSEVWSKESSFIVGVASETLHNNEELYAALCSAFTQAISFINEDMESAAKITCQYNGNAFEDEIEYTKAGVYSEKTVGTYELAKFMAEEGFIDAAPESYESLVFENVAGD